MRESPNNHVNKTSSKHGHWRGGWGEGTLGSGQAGSHTKDICKDVAGGVGVGRDRKLMKVFPTHSTTATLYGIL